MAEHRYIERILDTIEFDIAPLTAKGVEKGNKIFGAAILSKSDLSTVIAETNNELENPLWHGEVHCLKGFYELPADSRPPTSECIFIATHEPCSLCLSAITWTGFDNFWYLFGYEKTQDLFNIPHDLKILDEVFACPNGGYRRKNSFWTSHHLMEDIRGFEGYERKALLERVERLEKMWQGFSDEYQMRKRDLSKHIPLN